MKRIAKIILVVAVVALVILQFFRIDKAGASINESETLETAVSVPPDVSEMLGRSCNDCHTNSTIYPWYSNVQPIGWFLKNHIDEGREHLNFSIFNTYTAKRKAHKLDEICEQMESKEMPLPSYLWIHRDANLTDTERQALCDWAKAEKAKIIVE